MLKRIWNKVIALGLDDQMIRQEQKRVLILNTFSLILSVIYLAYTILSAAFAQWSLLPIQLIGLVIFVMPLLVNALKSYHQSRWFFSIASNLFFTLSSIFFGLDSGIHYALLVIGVSPLFFFEEWQTIIGLSIFSLVLFIGSAVFCRVYQPLFPIDHFAFYYINLLIVFLCFFFFVYLFIDDYRAFEVELLASNSQLEAKNRVLKEAKSELQSTCKDLVEAESELRAVNLDLRTAKDELEVVVAREKVKQLELEKREHELKELNSNLVASEAEMRQYLEEILQINQNLENTKGHLEQFFANQHDDGKRLKWVNEQLKKAQTQLVQAEKMSSLGQLTAGIAHEINNPINFVSAGAEVMQEMLRDIRELLQKYEDLEHEENKGKLLREIVNFKDEIQYNALVQEMSTTLDDILVGAARTADIVRGLRNFSRTDEQEARYADVHESLDSTFIILNNKIKGRIGVVKMYDPNMPEIECFPGQLNQVFMNLLSNAIQAIEDEGEISVITQAFENEVEVMITDNGKGMPLAIMNRIFEPFFTTKEVGEGTGLGLSISYGIIEKHQGSITVDSTLNVGTRFTIRLPKRLDSK